MRQFTNRLEVESKDCICISLKSAQQSLTRWVNGDYKLIVKG